MTRPKVPDDKRQRTAQACDICKRRKQKCNGLKPCLSCQKKNLTCEYTPNSAIDSGAHDLAGSPPKRRHFEDIIDNNAHMSTAPMPIKREDSFTRRDFMLDYESTSRRSMTSGPDEEAEVDGQMRMLRDPVGRLLYIGDSAALSFLKSIRTIVGGVDGPSEFTLDPSQDKIMEATIDLPDAYRTLKLLPDRETAEVLVRAYFVNTHGLVELLDSQEFNQTVEKCYSDPLSVQPSDLCLVYLVLAIGLVMATPATNTRDRAIVERLRSDPINRAELFFRSATSEVDVKSGFEDADFWSVQALALMTVYALAVSKRNTAYIHHGTAVRSAFALGLHRIGDATIRFQNEKLPLKRNVWRSLFILDRFLAVSLGRPLAISEEDCADDSLQAPTWSAPNGEMTKDRSLHANGLEAAVQACRVIGRILRKVYSKRKISTKVARDLAAECRHWAQNVHPCLDTPKLLQEHITPEHGMAILHTQLIGCHSIILFTRPFFLHILIELQKERQGLEHKVHHTSTQMQEYSKACVATATQTIKLVQKAYEYDILPRRNPFALYFLFTATLIIMSNEFANLYDNEEYTPSATHAVNIMSYCSVTDPQANRLLFILTAYRDVIDRKARHEAPRQRSQSKNISMMTAESSWSILPPILPRGNSEHQRRPTSPQLRRTNSANLVSDVSRASMSSQTRVSRPSDATSSGAIASPVSSHTSLSHNMAEGRQGNESTGSESWGGEHEFDFDTFWDFQSLATNGRGPAPDSAMQQADGGNCNMGFGNYSGFNNPIGSHGSHIMVIDPGVQLYPPAQYI